MYVLKNLLKEIMCIFLLPKLEVPELCRNVTTSNNQFSHLPHCPLAFSQHLLHFLCFHKAHSALTAQVEEDILRIERGIFDRFTYMICILISARHSRDTPPIKHCTQNRFSSSALPRSQHFNLAVTYISRCVCHTTKSF
jgi:hypothetical protein